MKPNTKTWKFTITKKILKHAKEKLAKNEIRKNIIRLPEGKLFDVWYIVRNGKFTGNFSSAGSIISGAITQGGGSSSSRSRRNIDADDVIGMDFYYLS